jgi:hypothetical protein
MDEGHPPICPACGVTMVPAELSAGTPRDGDWICLECEETDELDLEYLGSSTDAVIAQEEHRVGGAVTGSEDDEWAQCWLSMPI